MEIKRCINCMEELSEGVHVCPSCGYDNSKEIADYFGLRPGTLLNGRYFVGNILGQGGFGITYIGYDLLFQIRVAIKEYFPRLNASRDNSRSNTVRWTYTENRSGEWERGRDSFLKEARKMVKIDTIPEIVRIRDTFIENDTAYIIMDYVEGVNLKDYVIKNGTMKYSECLDKLKSLMEGLEKVHEAGIIHRDLSPDNIMLLKDGSVRLLDLGAAKDLNHVKSENSLNSQLVAKKGFSPAEQYIENGNIGTWTDVYAMCATIYFLISGKTVPDATDRMYNDTLSFDVKLKEPLPKSVTEALRNGLAIKPEDRTQTMKELVDELYNSRYYTQKNDKGINASEENFAYGNYSEASSAKQKEAASGKAKTSFEPNAFEAQTDTPKNNKTDNKPSAADKKKRKDKKHGKKAKNGSANNSAVKTDRSARTEKAQGSDNKSKNTSPAAVKSGGKKDNRRKSGKIPIIVICVCAAAAIAAVLSYFMLHENVTYEQLGGLDMVMKAGDTSNAASLLPQNAGEWSVKLESQNEAVATVKKSSETDNITDADIPVSGVDIGETEITVEAIISPGLL